MQFKNTDSRFGLIAILFHWIMAILVIGMLALGLYMTSMPITGIEQFKLYDLHKACGILILGLLALRIIWRLSNPIPRLSLPRWEQCAARIAHAALYVFMLAMPLSGWLMTSAGGFSASFFGLFTLPNIIAPNHDLKELFELIHTCVAYSLIACITLHCCAALKHHFIDKDDILKRMSSL